jgi:hypothetical protein
MYRFRSMYLSWIIVILNSQGHVFHLMFLYSLSSHNHRDKLEYIVLLIYLVGFFILSPSLTLDTLAMGSKGA